MDIPFELIFIEIKNNMPKRTKVRSFSESLKDLMESIDDYCVEVKELIDLNLIFSSKNANAKLKIEIFDMLPETEFKEGEENYFLPSLDERTIYCNSPKNKDIQFATLIPGNYIVEIDVENVQYYSVLKIVPKNVSENQLELMKNEIEMTLEGFSKDFSFRKNKRNLNENTDILSKINFLLSHSQNLINSLMQINSQKKYLIAKDYKYYLESPGNNIDLLTMRKNNVINKSPKVLSFKRKIEYDIPVNRGLIYILKEILQNINLFLKYAKKRMRVLDEELKLAEKYKNNKIFLNKEKISFNNIVEELNRIRNNINLLLNSVEFKFLKEDRTSINLLNRYSFYRNIYIFYISMNKDNLNNRLDGFSSYSSIYKESSKLYEVWAFIKIIELLKNSKYEFEKIRGWIFESSEKQYPVLRQGETIIFQNNDDLKIIIKYDEFIPYANVKISEQTLDENTDPLITTESNNRPDFRIDIYKKNKFKGTIIGDFKYRPLENIGNLNTYIGNKNSQAGYKVYRQLINYSHVLSYYLNSISRKKDPRNAVERVFCFYPVVQTKTTFKMDEGTRIIRYSLSPDEQNKNELENIREEIENIIDEL